jgi:hypothetical protein
MSDEIEDEELLEIEDVDELEEVLAEFKPARKKKKEPKETIEYVNKDEMWQVLKEYYTTLGDNYDWTTQKIKDKSIMPDVPLKLYRIIDDISEKMGYLGNFINYSYLDEMRGDGKIKMIKAIRDASFKLYSTTKVVNIEYIGTARKMYFWGKSYIRGTKNKKLKDRIIEPDDVVFTEGTDTFVTYKANPFGYFSMINNHSYINRIKKEKQIESTHKRFQEETWESLHSNPLYINVRRPKFIEEDECFSDE